MRTRQELSVYQVGGTTEVRGLKCVPPKFLRISSQNMTVFGNRAFKVVISENETFTVGPHSVRLVSLYEEEIWTHKETLGMHMR